MRVNLNHIILVKYKRFIWQRFFNYSLKIKCLYNRASGKAQRPLSIKAIFTKGISVHLIEKWRHFVSPKTLLRFRVSVRVRFRV